MMFGIRHMVVSTSGSGRIPVGLEAMDPGPVLAAFLVSVAGEDLSGV